uniref:Pectin acetylesterase n=1 Tax=Helianthus annuus TaxID=4232 RepID=A0A251V9M0_HELAN
MLFLNIKSSEEVKITLIESAVAKGAVCLDGSPPAYQFDKGFGDGVNNWLVHMPGGGWCHTIEDCVKRKTLIYGLGSSKLMPELNFTGLMSNQQDQNPNLYNWNRVYMRYCDGASFTGDVEEVDHDNNLYFRGARVFDAIVEELMSIGMKDAQNVLLSGCSAGGLASILNCDKFRGFFPQNTRVKCVSDAGYFPHVKDLSGEYRFEQYFDKIVTLHGSAKALPSECTSNMNPGLCFYPDFAMPYINTPIFIVNSAYDTWQVSNMFATNESDPKGEFTKCKNDLNECSTTQLKRLQDFRSDFLGSVSSVTKSSTEGMFINTCYTHCQTDQSTWFANATSKLDDKTIAEGVDDWFYDKSEFQKTDTEHVDPHYC